MAAPLQKTELLQGTLDLLILKTLSAGPLHGYAIVQRIQQRSEEVLVVEEGSLYPALYRMESKGWIAAEWGKSENNRRAKYYSLTRGGRKQLEEDGARGGNKWRRKSRSGSGFPAPLRWSCSRREEAGRRNRKMRIGLYACFGS